MLVLVNAEKILNFIMKITKGLPLLVKCIKYIYTSEYSECYSNILLLVLKLYIYIYNYENRVSSSVNMYRD